MPPYLRTALCPVASAAPRPGGPYLRPRADDGLALSLTVPCEPRSAAIARNAMTSALHAHGLDRYGPLATLAATELISTAAKLTTGDDLYLSLRHRDNALRLVVWDQHPHHADPDAVTLCEQRRRRSLWLLAAVVDDWGGEWGIGDARPPHYGTKSWVVLPW
ncbi:ATP-binding protein [Streptomyces sp. ISL-96]|uniref:ATP-binding protein n=1 Tax=Streptomyces sp. ISL-96 TaxID=2819191 RepID=UPI001BE6D5F1|nr:ATP-binding protein [Streptomyces sp. ISL-96]MBT2489183.1 ATP-binding protein [Streptomyces sp. ISL-96]